MKSLGELRCIAIQVSQYVMECCFIIISPYKLKLICKNFNALSLLLYLNYKLKFIMFT